jgi:methylmalonyl-CoA mutase N-terminal domain/subunit
MGKEVFEARTRDDSSSIHTVSGIPVKNIYRPEDLKDFNYEKNLADPGIYPYTRGVYPDMYRKQFWTMRQVAGIGGGKETRERIRHLLSMGETGIAIVPDVATTWGLDSDNPRAEGEVGRLGVALSSLQDMEDLFADLPIDKITVSLVTAGNAPYIMAMFVAMAQKRGIPLDRLIGSLQNDVIREYYSRGMWVLLPIEHTLKLCIDIIEYCTKEVPKWNVNTIAGYQTRESGGTAVQEVAFLLADTMAYVEACQQRGMNVDQFAPRFSFYMSAHTYLFEEVAKFRAVRRMYAKIMKEKYGAKDPRSYKFRFHCQTAANTLTAQQPNNNIVRVTFQSLAAILGGAQSLHTNAFDEAYATPTEESSRDALRIQQVAAYESGVADTVDPLAGSYYVETLTNTIEEKSWKLIEEIGKRGNTMLESVIKCINEGFFSKQLSEEYYRYQSEKEEGKRIVVGVNRFQTGEEDTIPTLEYKPEWEYEQIENLRKIKYRRDNDKVEASINEIRAESEKGKNLMPALIKAAHNYVTIGEVYSLLQKIHGKYTP